VGHTGSDDEPIAGAGGDGIPQQAAHGLGEGGFEAAVARHDFNQGVRLVDDGGDIVGHAAEVAEFGGKGERFELAAGDQVGTPVCGGVERLSVEGDLSRQTMGGHHLQIPLALAKLEHRSADGDHFPSGEQSPGRHHADDADHFGDRFEAMLFMAGGLLVEFGGRGPLTRHWVFQVIPLMRSGGERGAG